MVKIRLRRVGRKNAPFYRILVADSQSPRDGKFIEIIGQYAPRKSEGSLNVDEARANYWLGVGAQPTDKVHARRSIRQLLPYVERISAAILVVAGLYFVYYGIDEVRGTTSGGLALRLSDWQGRLATRINNVGPVTIGVILGAVVAASVVFVMRRRQSTP